MQLLGWSFLFLSWRLDSCRKRYLEHRPVAWGDSVSSHGSQTTQTPPPIHRRLLKKMGLRVRETLKMDVG